MTQIIPTFSVPPTVDLDGINLGKSVVRVHGTQSRLRLHVPVFSTLPVILSTPDLLSTKGPQIEPPDHVLCPLHHKIVHYPHSTPLLHSSQNMYKLKPTDTVEVSRSSVDLYVQTLGPVRPDLFRFLSVELRSPHHSITPYSVLRL